MLKFTSATTCGKLQKIARSIGSFTVVRTKFIGRIHWDGLIHSTQALVTLLHLVNKQDFIHSCGLSEEDGKAKVN